MKMKTSTLEKTPNQKVPENKIALSLTEVIERFDEELKRRYWAENVLLDLLPDLEKSATSYELAIAIKSHATVTKHQIDRLLHVFDELEWHASGSRYEIMENLMDTARKSIEAKSGFERDEAIVNSCKRIMQHEIAIYEKLLAYSRILDKELAAEYILKAIREEEAAHVVLSEIELKSIYSA